MSETVALSEFKPADYKTDLKPVWCAGCGDFGALTALYRALTLAAGVKVSRPDLKVIAVGGDGDGLAIGGNHFMHAARRNLDVAYFMMDNEIYGLTKGQTAPTTPAGDKTKSTHYGNPEPSIDPCELAISVGATWVARAFSGDLKGTVELMVKALSHRGFAFLNVMSPCVTWRGDDQFKTLKAKQRALPADHDPTSRPAALVYTRETEVVTTGVLYEIVQPSYLDRLDAIKKVALAGKPAPTVADIIKTFEPSF